ncbi:hypothetical protein STSP2_02598 [Anaerohalosphaera lusitana]|uniref:Uncharacterized protein n=1 Tax=Anaerohalosphaera lusitana TaxID=1936003 RepID=A0A1U9NND6_9BACT|nr:hypothetical protein [Anaerohalosphaera lusitana]AQT69409.1 hypothetical protein STSP2_02598 [Anaerohalosphaera lusitana]
MQITSQRFAITGGRIAVLGTMIAVLAFCSSCGPDKDALARQRFERMASVMERQGFSEDDNSDGQAAEIPVHVEIVATNSENYAALESLWEEAETDDVTVYNAAQFRDSGLRVAVAGEGLGERLDEVKQNLHLYEGSDMVLLLTPGVSGYMPLGKGIYQASFVYDRTEYSPGTSSFENARRYLRLSAERTAGDKIRLRIVPAFDNLQSDKSGLDMNALSAQAVLESGESVLLAEKAEPRSPGTALLSYKGVEYRFRTVLVITPNP